MSENTLTKTIALAKKVFFLLKLVSEPQIMLEGKTKADEKAQHTRYKYVSILKRLSTQHPSIRWGFEASSIEFATLLIITLFSNTFYFYAF